MCLHALFTRQEEWFSLLSREPRAVIRFHSSQESLSFFVAHGSFTASQTVLFHLYCKRLQSLCQAQVEIGMAVQPENELFFR